MGNMMFLAASNNASSGSGYTLWLLLLGVIAVMYFVMIRPQRNRQRQAQQMHRDLRVGHRVRTTAGIHGTVTSIDNDDVMLEVAPGVEMRFMRRAVMDVIHDGGPAADEAEPDMDATQAGEDGAEDVEDGEDGEDGAQAGTAGPKFAENGPSAD